ncbi:unnamed protein product [Penicillium salamii]|nr:unnamed protein product [Penicillium salamii]
MGVRRLLKKWKGEESPRQKSSESDSRPTQICAPALTDATKTRAETIDSTPPPGAGGTDQREGSLSRPGNGATPYSTSPQDLPTSPEAPLEILNAGASADADADEALRNNLHSEGGETEDLWQLSFEELTQEEQGRLQAFLATGQAIASDQRQAPSFKATDFEDLIAVTRAKQEALSDRIWSFDFYGRKIVPRDYTERVITCLTIVGDVGVPLMPQPASIVWPLVKGLMQVPIDADEETAAVLMTADILVRTTRCGTTYEKIFREKIKDQYSDLWLDFRSALFKLYTASLRLMIYALRQCDKRTGRRLVNAFLNPSKAQDQISSLETCRANLREIVMDCQSMIGDDIDASVMEFLRKFSMFSSVIEQRFDELFERLDNQEVMDILEWISPYRALDRHNIKSEARTPETCEWLLENSTFNCWEQSSSPKVIWLQGSRKSSPLNGHVRSLPLTFIAGTGKSFLTARVIDHLRANLHPGEGLAFYYCQRSGQNFEKSSDVIRAIFRQLATPAHELQEDEMRKDVRDLFAQSKNMTHPSISICKEQIIKSLSQYSQITLVLDALDECAEPRKELFDLIDSLVSQSDCLVRVFVSSRPEPEIEERFRDELTIKTEVPDVKDDIRSFINKKIGELRWNSNTAVYREDVVDALVEKSDGMFLWASLHIDQLHNVQLGKAMLRRIKKMPQGLTRTYKEIYEQISADEVQKTVVDRAFIWVMCSYGPMSSEQLLAAIRHDANHDELEEVIDTNTLLSLCKSLLVLDEPSNRFRFCHASVLEYIQRELWNSRNAHCYAAKSCLRFMMLVYGEPAPDTVSVAKDDDSSISSDEDLSLQEDPAIFSRDYPFHFYSRHHWMRHIQHQEQLALSSEEFDHPLSALLKAFLNSPSKCGTAYRAWFQDVSKDVWLPRDTTIFTDALTLEYISPANRPILAICRFSFHAMLKDWWDRDDMFLPYQNSQEETPLIVAARAGCNPICEKLLDRKASVDHYGKRFNALGTAAYYGHFETARLLIQRGASVDMTLQWDVLSQRWKTRPHEGQFGSALSIAASTGDLEMARLLIDNGATVDKPLEGDYKSALATAVCFGHIPMIELLIDNGATVDMKLQGEFGSALSVAASERNLDVTKLLIKNGADVNMELDGQTATALITAAYSEDLDMVKLLVQEGAAINMPLTQGRHGSALSAASSRGQLTIAEYLIENGANVNFQFQGPWNHALASAAFSGLSMTQFLVERGADPDMRYQVTGRMSTGSVLADAVSGRVPAVEYLIDNGATVNLETQALYRTALAAAANRRNTDMVELLISKGASVNQPLGGSYGSALAHAAYREHVSVAALLLAKGACVNAPLQGYFGSALIVAAWVGGLRMMACLVDHGADVDLAIPTGHFGSALAAACAAGCVKVVNHLVDERKVNVNLPLISGIYGTALNAASYWGRTECVEILLRAGATIKVLEDHAGFSSALEAAQAETCESREEFISMSRKARFLHRKAAQIAADKEAVMKVLLEVDS